MNILKRYTRKYDQKKYPNRNFVIISNNCWGIDIYKTFEVSYNTPFVGVLTFGPDFVRLLERFDHYMSQELIFIKESKKEGGPFNYPIAMLDDIEIHFYHYENEEEAITKWTRRLARMREIKNKDNYFFKVCDRDDATKEDLIRFHQLPFKNKISFGAEAIDSPHHIKIKQSEIYQNRLTVPNGFALYKYGFRYFDILEWINSGKVVKNWYSKLKSFLSLTR